MKINLLPVIWQPGDGISLADFFAHYRSQTANREFEFKGKWRKVYCDESSGCYALLVLSSREYGSKCITETVEGRTVIGVDRGQPNKPASDYNFLVIDKGSGRGLYSHYYLSCSFERSTTIAKGYYDALREQLIDREYRRLGGSKKGHMRDARRMFKRSLKGSMLIQEEKFEELLEKLKEINSVSVSAVSLRVSEKTFEPDVSAAIRSESHTFNLVGGVPISKARETTTKIFARLGARRGRVSGKNLDDALDSVNFTRNIDSFGEYNFDDFTSNMSFVADDLSSCWAVEQMTQKIDQHADYFRSSVI